MFYDMTQQYHAERFRSAAEQRRADAELGMMTADVSRLWRRIVRALAPARSCWPGIQTSDSWSGGHSETIGW